MHTDMPLKVLTTLRAVDLLPFLGVPADRVVEVVVRDLPITRRALDTLLRIRSPQGQEYLHLLEWQGYPDPAVLWRVLSYLGLVGQAEPHTTIIGTIVYLKPTDDTGDTLRMVVDGQLQHEWSVRCIRLWEQDAVAALATGNLALATLSPLMHGADAALVEQAARAVLATAPLAQQADLLTILGVFAAPLMEPGRFINLVTREKLMSSDLIEYLVQDVVKDAVAQALQEQEAQWQNRLATEREAWLAAEREARLAAEREARLAAEREACLAAEREARLAAEREARLAAEREAHLTQLQTEHEALAALLALCFPDAPLRLAGLIHQISHVDRLRSIRLGLPTMPDLATLEQHLRDAVG